MAGTLQAGPLGLPGDYNLFVTGNATLSNTDVQGRVAVGGNATFTSFGIGSGLAINPARLDLVVGQTLNYTNGQLFAGSGTATTLGTISGVGTPNGTLTQAAPPFSFATQAASLLSLSTLYDAMGGTLVNAVGSSLTINANSPGVNVFRIAGFSGLTSITVNIAAGATVIVNVNGASDTLSNAGMTVNGDVQQLLFNYHSATSLSLSSFGLKGSLLAPSAAFSFNNGFVDGNVIVASVTGNGQTHNLLFNGNIPSVPEPGTWLLLSSSLAWIGIRARRKTR